MLLHFLLAAAIVVVVGMPLLTLLHEFGHGVTAAFAVGGRVTVVQGPAPARLRLRVGRIDVRLHGPVGPKQAMVGWAVWGTHDDPRRHIAATAAGPLVSAAAAAGSALGADLCGGFARLLLVLLAGAALLQALSSALPVRYAPLFGVYGGEASDGLRIVRLLQGSPEPAPLLERASVEAAGAVDGGVGVASGPLAP